MPGWVNDHVTLRTPYFSYTLSIEIIDVFSSKFGGSRYEIQTGGNAKQIKGQKSNPGEIIRLNVNRKFKHDPPQESLLYYFLLKQVKPLSVASIVHVTFFVINIY
jgi:hypothetical protein